MVKLIHEEKKPPLEEAVQAKIMVWMKGFKKWSGDVITKNMYGSNGIADTIGCWDGRYVGIEIKRFHTIKPSPTQTRWLDKKKKVKGIIGVAWSIDSWKAVFMTYGINLDNEERK